MVTVTLDGVPATAKLKVDLVYARNVATSFEGPGSSGSSWSHTYRLARGPYPLSRKAVRLTVFPTGSFFDGVDVSQHTIERSTRLAAC